MPTFAAVDIGSNSVRLKISRLVAHRLVEIHEDREVTRLGESVFRSGFLSPEAIALTVKVLRRFHRAAQRAGADSVRVVATSALRDARNSRAFLEWVRSATGWSVEIISGVEEARLIHLGLTSTLRVRSSPVLMIDLGGGSCELTISKKGHIQETVSLPLGAVRLTNDFLHHDPPRKSELRQLRSLIDRCKLGGFRYSPLGLRDGLLAQMSAEYDRATRSGRQIESERQDSILSAVAHYRVNLDHAIRVRDSALQLFADLRRIHRLPPEYKEWIAAAAMLCEVGDYVNRTGRHRHTYYIISHSEILGYTMQQRKLIGAIARYLGKSRPSAGDAPIKSLLPSDQKQVAKASLLLRLAWALNLGRSGALKTMRVRIHDTSVDIVLVPKHPMSVDLELWAVEKEKAYFRAV